MLTNGELALLSPLFGFLGVVAGSLITWLATSTAARRQQVVEANQKRHDRRAEVYENMLAEMSQTVIEMEERIKAGGSAAPKERDEQVRREEALWRARSILLASPSVRAAYRDWVKLLMTRWEITQAPVEVREGERLKWLSKMGFASDDVSRVMADDLEALDTLPAPPSAPRFLAPPR